jgi:hypothetical protein
VILSFTLLGPFQVLLLDGLFNSFFRALIHEEIITGEPSDSSQGSRPALAGLDELWLSP